nr:TPA_asm: hypothetical protein HUJ06_021368 [Nelumbo nucifera]
MVNGNKVSPVDEEIPRESSDDKDQEDAAAQVEPKPWKKKALLELRSKLEDAILGNTLLNDHPSTECEVSPETENLEDISLWGIPLLPSKGHEGTDVILLKFLKAQDYKVSETFEMLRKTLIWRKEFKTEGILEENFDFEFDHVLYTNSTDKEGHPLCYNICGAFDNELYEKTFGTEKNCEEFLRLSVQFMEKGIQKLDFKDGGVDSMVQITDMRISQGLAMKELHGNYKKVVSLFQENYPDIIFKSIFINVPFWCYAYHKMFSRFITKRAKAKFIFVRRSRVSKTLLKFIAPENIPIQYGGLKRENDDEFAPEDGASELVVKSGAIESIEIPVEEPGVTVIWDLMFVGRDMSYREEFIPDDECSYTVLIKKEKKVGGSVRNSFYINEPGRVLLTVDNGSYKKKKVYYRFKAKPTVPIYLLTNS